MNKKLLGCALALACAATAGSASAATIAMVPGTSSPQAGGSVAVQLTSADVSGQRGWNATFQLPVGMTAANVVPGAANILGALGSCIYDGGSNRIIVIAGNINTDLAAGVACSFNLVIGGMVAVNTVLPVEVVGTPGCNTTMVGGMCTTTVTDRDAGTAGTQAHVATVTDAPVARTLTYTPAPGPINFAAGMTPGAAAPAQPIQVNVAGNDGNASISGCAITGAGASSFSVSPTSISFSNAVPNPNPSALTVGCTYPTSNASATLTCSETDADSTNVSRSWTLSCPAPNVAPTVTSATTSPLTVAGATLGTQGTGTIDLVASGGSGAGSTAVSCTSTGNVQIAASPGTPSGTGPVAFNVVGTAQPTDIRVGVVLTSNAQAPAGTVTCTVAGGADIVVAVNAPAGTVFTPPQFIPSTSTWSTLALLGLLGLFGMLAVGFRRNG